jgi:DNA sulfur modification protein DndD
VHSKTSKEFVRIYDAIRLLECQLFTARKKDSGEKLLVDINGKIEWSKRKMASLARAPDHVQQEHRARLNSLEKRAADLVQELEFINRCLASVPQVNIVPDDQPLQAESPILDEQ